MNFDYIEGLNEKQISELYNDILTIESTQFIGTLGTHLCSGYCECRNGRRGTSYAYWNGTNVGNCLCETCWNFGDWPTGGNQICGLVSYTNQSYQSSSNVSCTKL